MKRTLSVLTLSTALMVGLASPEAFAGAIANNQIINGTFDDNLDGWDVDAPVPSWSNFDAQNLTFSGSLRQPADTRTGFLAGALQCLPATHPGELHTLFADVFLDPAAGADDDAFLGLTFFSDSDCGGSGGEVLSGRPSDGHMGLKNQWHQQSISVTAPANANSYQVNLTVFQSATNSWDGYFDNVSLETGTCAASSTALCLSDDRFKVEATWRKQNGDTGVANVQKLTDETGYLWFFNPDNVEVIVKVKDACASSFNRFWVFASGLTNVEVSLRVTDTLTGLEWTRVTPLGQPFPPILDTDAFDTCPILGEPPI